MTPTEPFTLLDMTISSSLPVTTPSGWTGIFYVLYGSVEIAAGAEHRLLHSGEVIGVRQGAECMVKSENAQVLYMARPILDQALLVQGMYAMENQEELNAAKRRFHAGELGDVVPYAKLLHPDKPYTPAGQDANLTVTIEVVHQAFVKHYDEGWWQLHLQYCRYAYSDYEEAFGYRFIWTDPDGEEKPYRTGGYIPYMEYIGRLLAIAKQEGWADIPYKDSF